MAPTWRGRINTYIAYIYNIWKVAFNIITVMRISNKKEIRCWLKGEWSQ